MKGLEEKIALLQNEKLSWEEVIQKLSSKMGELKEAVHLKE